MWLRTVRTTLASGCSARAARFARIQTRIDRVELGNFGDRKRVGRGVSELRIDFGPGYRVYYGSDGEELVILLAGGTKKLQARDIATAKACWRAYQQEKRKCQ